MALLVLLTLAYSIGAAFCWHGLKRDRGFLSVLTFLSGGVLAVFALAAFAAFTGEASFSAPQGYKVHPLAAAALLYAVTRLFDWTLSEMRDG